MNFWDVILNIIVVSIPEEFLLIALIILLTGNYKFISKRNLIKTFFLGVLPIAIISNITIYIIEIPFLIRIPINIIMFCVAGMFLLKDEAKDKIVIVTILCFCTMMLLEYILAIFYSEKSSSSSYYINKNALSNFLITSPIRVAEYIIIYMLYIKSHYKEFNILKSIEENRPLKRCLTFFMVVYMSIYLYIGKKIIIDDMLSLIPEDERMLVITFIIILLISSIAFPWLTLLNVYPNIKREKV